MMLWWLPSALLLMQLQLQLNFLFSIFVGSSKSVEAEDQLSEEMYFHLHVRVQGDDEIYGKYSTISSHAVELTNTHPTQSLELFNIQSDNPEFYFSASSFPVVIAPFKKIEMPFTFLPHLSWERGERSSEVDENKNKLTDEITLHSANFQIHCDLIYTEFTLNAKSASNILATTSIGADHYIFHNETQHQVQPAQYQTHVDPYYPENSFQTEIRGSIIHIYSKYPLQEDFFLYEYYADNPHFSVTIFDPIDFEVIQPAIEDRERYLLSVVINPSEEENDLIGFIYFKSQYGDYVVPVNLQGSQMRKPVANVESIDFGVVLSTDSESKLKPFFIEIFNPTSTALLIGSVAYEPSISNEKAENFELNLFDRFNRSQASLSEDKREIIIVDVKNSNVLPMGSTNLAVRLVNLDNSNLSIENSGRLAIYTSKGPIYIPYHFTLLQGDQGLEYNINDISLMPTYPPGNVSSEEFYSMPINSTIPIYNNNRIPVEINDMVISENCKRKLKVMKYNMGRVLVPPESAFLMYLHSAPPGDVISCFVDIHTNISKYRVPIVVKYPPILFTSNTPTLKSEEKGVILDIQARGDDLLPVFITNTQVRPLVVTYGPGARVGRIPSQLQYLLDNFTDHIDDAQSIGDISKSSFERFLFEDLGWKSHIFEIGHKTIISKTYHNLLKRLFQRGSVQNYFKDPYESWDGHANVTIPSGGTLRIDLFRSNEIVSSMIEDNVRQEKHYFKFLSYPNNKVMDEVRVVVRRIERVNKTKDLRFLFKSPNGTHKMENPSKASGLDVTKHRKHTLQIHNPHNEIIELPKSIHVWHPTLMAQGPVNSSAYRLAPNETVDMLYLEEQRLPGGKLDVMRSWISCVLGVIGYKNDVYINSSKKILCPSIDKISFSISLSDYFILEELYTLLGTLIDDMNKVERGTLMPVVERVQSLYHQIPDYFWVTNGTIIYQPSDLNDENGDEKAIHSAAESISLRHRLSLPTLETQIDFQTSHVGVASLAYVEITNPSDIPIVCTLSSVDDSVFVQGVGGKEPPWWGGGRYWMRNPPLLDNGAMIGSSIGDLVMSTHNVTISSQTGAMIHLVNPSLHTSSSFTHSCGDRCSLRNEVLTTHANLAHVATGPVVAKWDTSNTDGFFIGASRGTFVKPKDDFVQNDNYPTFAIPATAKKTQVIQGGTTARLGPILFRPTGVGKFFGNIGIANGWNGLQAMKLEGNGVLEELSVNEILVTNSGGVIQVGSGGYAQKLLFSEHDTFKVVKLENTGTVPVTFKVSLGNGSCQDQSFILPGCHEDFVKSEQYPSIDFKIDKYTVPFRHLSEVDQDYVTLQPSQRTYIELFYADNCVYDEMWTKLLIAHKKSQSFRPSIQRIFVGYKRNEYSIPCYPVKKTLPNLFHLVQVKLLFLIIVCIYLSQIKLFQRKHCEVDGICLSENRKAVLRCLTCSDPTTVQLIELSREQGKYNANRAKLKFVESRSVPSIKDLSDALYVTTSFEASLNAGIPCIQPIGLNWRAYPKVFHFSADSNVVKLLKARKAPHSLADIHEVSNSEEEESIASSDAEDGDEAMEEKIDSVESDLKKSAKKPKQVKFVDNAEIAPNGFLKVGSKKIVSRKSDPNLVLKVANKASKAGSGRVHEDVSSRGSGKTNNHSVDSINPNKKHVGGAEEKKKSLPSKKRGTNKSNNRHGSRSKTVIKSSSKSKPNDRLLSTSVGDHNNKDMKNQSAFSLPVDMKPDEASQPPPVLAPPPGFSSSPLSKGMKPIIANDTGENASTPGLNGDWSSLMKSSNFNAVTEIPITDEKFSHQSSDMSDKIDDRQYGSRDIYRQTSLNSRMDPTFDDDVGSMGQELPLYGFSDPIQSLSTPFNSSKSDFNVENFLSGVLDENIEPDEDFGLQNGNRNFFHFDNNDTSGDEWQSDQQSLSNTLLEQSQTTSSWNADIILPIIDGSGFGGESGAEESRPWWDNAQISGLNYHSEDDDIKTDNE